MRTFKTIADLYKAVNIDNNGQLNVGMLSTMRANFGNGWEDFRLDNDALRDIFEQTTMLLGGHQKTREIVRYRLNNTPISHWGLERMHIVESKGNYIVRYCAGQDYTSEIKEIRNYIKA